MEPWLRRSIGLAALLAPGLHLASDALEWVHRGFTPLQLMINYAGFLVMPAMILGLYAAQRPRIAAAGLAGAVLYGVAFIYFAHTTLVALSAGTPDYATLWTRLGLAYTLHGVVMIVGGLLFAWASLRARVLPPWSVGAFALGLAVNLVLGVLPAPAILETLGSALRNVGLMGMGAALWPSRIPGAATA